jgi:large subunit ribosomal protein L10
MLARVLAEPASMFARAIKAVGDKLGGGDAAVEASAADATAEAPAETSVEAVPEAAAASPVEAAPAETPADPA